jgi:hypothetical protein
MATEPGDVEPPEKGNQMMQVKKEMQKKGGVWTTWLSIDGEPVDGSEKTHENIQDANRWINSDQRN